MGGVLFTLFRYFGQIGDDLFLMCSAWFLCEKTSLKANKSIKMVLDSFLFSIVGLAVAYAFIKPSSGEIIRSIFPVTFQTNWYVGCYIIYFLICPLLNNAVRVLSRKQFLAFVILLFFAYSVVATVFPSFYFTRLVAFISIHYYVMYSKKYGIYDHSRRYDFLAIIVLALAVLAMIICVSFLGKQLSFLHNKNLYLCQFYNPLIILLTLPIVFVAAKSTLESKTINYISSLSLSIYLIHGNYFWQAYGKYAVLELFGNNGIPKIGATLVLFIVVVVGAGVIASVYQGTLGHFTYIVSIWGEKTLKKIIEE